MLTRVVSRAAPVTARVVLGVAALLVVGSLAAPLLGWRSDVVLSGSMAPTLAPGSLVLSEPARDTNVTVGQVVLVDDPARPGTTLIHRVVARTADGSLFLKGDANPSADSTPVSSAHVRAVPRLVLPYVGMPSLWRRHHAYLNLILTALVGAGLVTATRRAAPRQTGRRRTRGRGAASTAAAVLLLATGAVWHASYARFTSSAVTGTNILTSGTVTIGNDRSGAAVFTVAAAVPDTTTSTLAPPGTGAFTASTTDSGGSACIKVTYSGTLSANIRLYATVTNTGGNGGLGQYLLFDVDTGSDPAGGSDLSCTTYTSPTYLLGSASNTTVTLNSMPTTYATGYAWNNVVTSTVKWYRLSWLLPANSANNAQSQVVQATFTWEAHNT